MVLLLSGCVNPNGAGLPAAATSPIGTYTGTETFSNASTCTNDGSAYCAASGTVSVNITSDGAGGYVAADSTDDFSPVAATWRQGVIAWSVMLNQNTASCPTTETISQRFEPFATSTAAVSTVFTYTPACDGSGNSSCTCIYSGQISFAPTQ